MATRQKINKTNAQQGIGKMIKVSTANCSTEIKSRRLSFCVMPCSSVLKYSKTVVMMASITASVSLPYQTDAPRP